MVNKTGAESRETAMQPSSSSNNTIDIIDDSQNYDDGYEKPYTTLVVQNLTKDEHVYLKTNKVSYYENLTPFEKAASVENGKQKTNLHVYENDHQENVNLNNIDNDFDNHCQQSYIDPKYSKAVYINLMLKQ